MTLPTGQRRAWEGGRGEGGGRRGEGGGKLVPCMYCVIQEVCHQYWPSSGVMQVGEFTVEHMGEEKLEGFILRTFSVVHKKVKQDFPSGRGMIERENGWVDCFSSPFPTFHIVLRVYR